ncbi:MAG: hypothetical protein QN141_02010 [Armatimonadota bacterium]|nr:hypothetical protein [Armatimonadota bacterium]MDR7450675.1 hypothetical protein [Armatimonadota bacterium]MDR7466031.1 hypothetical protein [Armatimonadota bacterium]MDR7493932.1 hypothetical protein [Armatimonadota bacterium]MDR7504037.1 hypothetical protein [Armatimonadota bacterium]
MRVAAVLLVLLAGLTVPAAGSGWVLTVRDADGRRLWSLPVRLGDEVVLAYTNSIYLAPTEERLVVTARGFALVAVRSTSEAVLDYNGLRAPYAREGAYYAAQASARLPELILRVGATGRQRLIVHGRAVPLFQAGAGTQLRVTVARR